MEEEMMEWLKTILENAVITDGKLDVEATMKSINAEFPKHAVPKQDYNDKVKELTTANDTIKDLKKNNADNEELQQKVKNYETEIAGYKTAAENAIVDIVVEQCKQDGLDPMSINPVVGECNDCRINQIQKRAVGTAEVRRAFASATDDFEEGDVGAGAGTLCYGLKGGIGSASRVIRIGETEYTIGVLVQSNFGATEDFVLNGEAVGAKILDWKQEKDDMAASEEDKGSIMSILATDLPLTSRQLKRILRRTGVGIARTGGYTGHGSGEVMIGFTTANRIPSNEEEELLQIQAIPEQIINRAFLAAAEAEQEAILNSMTAAEHTRGCAGELYYSLSQYLEDRNQKQ